MSSSKAAFGKTYCDSQLATNPLSILNLKLLNQDSISRVSLSFVQYIFSNNLPAFKAQLL